MLLGSVCSAVLAGIGIVILAVCILAPTEGHALHFAPVAQLDRASVF